MQRTFLVTAFGEASPFFGQRADLGTMRARSAVDLLSRAFHDQNISALSFSNAVARNLFPNLPIGTDVIVYIGQQCSIDRTAQLRPEEARLLRDDCLLMDTDKCVIPRTKAFAVPLRPGDVVLDPSISFKANIQQLFLN